jgi:hypothetical protein
MRIIITILVILLIGGVSTFGGQSLDYRSHPEVLDNGGGRSVRGTRQVVASIGQPAIGIADCPGQLNRAGFLSGACAHPSPRTNKETAITDLRGIKPFLPPSEHAKIDEVIALIRQSLYSFWWIDSWHLNPRMQGGIPQCSDAGESVEPAGFEAYPVPYEKRRYGEYVFLKERDAAARIRLLLRNDWYLPKVLLGLKAAAWGILGADSALAHVKIAEAEQSGGDQYELSQAKNAMQLAEMMKRSSRQYYDLVVFYYGKAWLHAVRAQEKAPPLAGTQIAGIADRKPIFAFYGPYPNPARSNIALRYELAGDCNVSLMIFDVTGRLVRTLVNERKHAGCYVCEWNGCDERGVSLPSGAYVCCLMAGPSIASEKLIVVR